MLLTISLFSSHDDEIYRKFKMEMKDLKVEVFASNYL